MSISTGVSAVDTYLFVIAFASLFVYVFILRFNNRRLNRILDEYESRFDEMQQQIIDMGYQLYNVRYKPSPDATSGYVYVIHSTTGYYKIGKAINPNDRLKTFEVKLPFEIEPLILIRTSDYSGLETALHNQFCHKRGNGEWFSLSECDISWLQSYPGSNKLESKK